MAFNLASPVPKFVLCANQISPPKSYSFIKTVEKPYFVIASFSETISYCDKKVF